MTPYRMFKGLVSEGGIRSPLIMSGPGVAETGSRCDAFADVMDMAATILDVSMTPHPGTIYEGRRVEQMRGHSMLPVLSGQASVVHPDDTAVSCELFGGRAVRRGNFKLLLLAEPSGTGDWQLYDLANDPGEMNDLSATRPDLRSEMIEIWDGYARETGVILPDWN